jgi:AAA15 family ATPase/GTPase
VWAWNEHKIEALLNNTNPENRMVIIIDEIEEHLHPKWQRVILPALINIYTNLSNELKIQYLISTHSPLILASSETIFENQIDSLFNFKADNINGFVELVKLEFIKYGPVNSWLTSPIFNLSQARAQEAETTIIQAKQLQLESDPNKKQINMIHQKLLKELAEDDPFWPRWIYFAEKNGVLI